MDLSVELLKLSVADGGGEDRLSALPDDVLIHILVLVKDAAAAARTSILASRWRRLWPLLPELRFGSIEHHLIGAALATHEAPDLSLILAHTKDASPESLSAWLPIAARSLSGAIHLEVVRRESETEIGERCAAIDLPCFEKAITIKLKLGFLGLALPPSGVFSRLGDLKLVDIQLHGQSSGLGDLLSSQRCPSLRFLRVSDVRGLDNFNIQSDSLLHMKLSYLHHLQQLTVVAPALKRLKVSRCFADPLNPDLSVANISAPQLTSLGWENIIEPSSTQLDKMMQLENLGIELFILEAEEAFEHNQYCMTLLRRFQHIHTLDLLIFYPPSGERCAAIDLPCFEKAITIKLKLGFLGLALPPSRVFSRLGDLQLVDIQLHGQSSRLGDLLSSQRCPSLMFLVVSDVRGLDSLNIDSDSLLHLKLFYLQHLKQLTVVAPALKRLKVIRCFTDPLNPHQSVVNISAPQLMSLGWKNFRDPSSIQLDEGICTGPYLMDHMPRLPDITALHMGVVAFGHSVGAILFNVVRSCTGVKALLIGFLAELEEQTPCPSGCICDEPPNWRTEELALNCLEKMEIQGMRGTEHEVSFVQRLFRWETVLKEVTVIFHELITESKAKELRQLLLSFSRPDICLDISRRVP